MKKSINYWSFVGKDIYQAMDLAKAAGFEGIELALMPEGSTIGWGGAISAAQVGVQLQPLFE